jgi:hypothetical protein
VFRLLLQDFLRDSHGLVEEQFQVRPEMPRMAVHANGEPVRPGLVPIWDLGGVLSALDALASHQLTNFLTRAMAAV